MKPKEIYIGTETSVGVWANDNRNIIMNALYDNVFDFVYGDELTRCVLKVISQPPTHKSVTKLKRVGLSVDFIISRDDIDETIDKLIAHLVELEEYEKCAELVKLKSYDA